VRLERIDEAVLNLGVVAAGDKRGDVTLIAAGLLISFIVVRLSEFKDALFNKEVLVFVFASIIVMPVELNGCGCECDDGDGKDAFVFVVC
jgi:hypothetical protein